MKFMIIISSIVIVAVGVTILLGWIFSAPVYRGPVSDHFDGKRFRNPGNVEAKGFKDLWKWMRTRERGEWSERMDIPPGPAPAKRVEGDTLVVTFINHSTFLIQTMGLNILTDPVWSERASPVPFAGPKRMRPPGIRFEDLPAIDIILLTHNHYDHLDIRTMKKLWAQHKPTVYCPLGVGPYLKKKGIENVVEMDWWDQVAHASGIEILSTPAQHFSGRGMFDRDRTLWSGFALLTGGGSIYYSGDTGYGSFFKEIGERISPIRLSFIPIGAYKPEWFMAPIHTSPEDALRIHREIGSPVSIGMHFGTFPLADDGEGEPEGDIRIWMEKMGMDEREFLVLEEGVCWSEMPSDKNR
jgi:L-ascorbate metabolism protein UlaG (beta-lactamase superfamily)